MAYQSWKSVIPSRIYGLPKLKKWMCELYTYMFLQIWSIIWEGLSALGLTLLYILFQAYS